jgi:hypothetical protein
MREGRGPLTRGRRPSRPMQAFVKKALTIESLGPSIPIVTRVPVGCVVPFRSRTLPRVNRDAGVSLGSAGSLRCWGQPEGERARNANGFRYFRGRPSSA